MQSLQDLARDEMERKLKEQEEERERFSVSYKNEDSVNLFIPDIPKCFSICSRQRLLAQCPMKLKKCWVCPVRTLKDIKAAHQDLKEKLAVQGQNLET